MKGRKISLRSRIFFSMIVLTIFSLLLILFASYLQYNSQSEDYNLRRLFRKETQVKTHLNYLMQRDTAFQEIQQKKANYQQEFTSIAAIHKVQYALFTLEGLPLFYSYAEMGEEGENYRLSQEVVAQLFEDQSLRLLQQNQAEKGKFQSSYSVLSDENGQPYVILYFPYFEDVSFSTTELNTFLTRVYQISLLMTIITFSFAFLLSGFITRPIENLRNKIDKIGLLKGNERVTLDNASKEIDSLLTSFNSMLDALEASAEKLAKSEREQAWQEMAKQVAHEIKNPLTPMRLTIQSFQQRFDPSAENGLDKLNDFSKTLIEQIDTMSRVASAFSDFATLPQPNILEEDITEITRLATEIFDNAKIKLNFPSKAVVWPIDRTQWIRVMTNLIQNAIQAVPQGKSPEIEVTLRATKQKLKVQIKDNGTGISQDDIPRVFEPKFTTKTGGMGLGLAIVKNIISSLNGTIDFNSSFEKGTTFYIELNR
jgi:two-component system nitrogen regulation sensor histidine kinase NtrY